MTRFWFACAAASLLNAGCGSFKERPKAPRQRPTPAPGQTTSPPEKNPTPQSTSSSGSADAPSPSSPEAPPPPYTHLVFSAIDPLASPWQASIYRLDLASQTVERLLTGESADPALYRSGGEVLFFNRYFDSQNFRRLTPVDGGLLTISAQQQFAGGEIGDPHDALYLGQNRVLLAHFTQGKLIVMEQSSGREMETVQVDWDLPADVPLKPEALLLAEVDGKQFVYVVHQALWLKDGLVLANGTQQVFVLALVDVRLTPVDLDPAVAKVQGIKIKGSFPMPVRFAQRDKFLFVSMCSRLVIALDNDPSTKCVNAVEEIDPKTNTVGQLWDLDGSGLYMNGPVTPGPDPQTFYANVDQQLTPDTFEKRVVRMHLTDRSVATAYRFHADSGGFWGSFYDETAKTLYVGDLGSGSVGKFVGLKEGSEPRDMPLEGVPYSGVFMTGPGL